MARSNQEVVGSQVGFLVKGRRWMTMLYSWAGCISQAKISNSSTLSFLFLAVIVRKSAASAFKCSSSPAKCGDSAIEAANHIWRSSIHLHGFHARICGQRALTPILYSSTINLAPHFGTQNLQSRRFHISHLRSHVKPSEHTCPRD